MALFKRLDPMMLKGKEHPIAPFVCIAQQGSDMWETHKQLRMIGRIKLQNSVRAGSTTRLRLEPVNQGPASHIILAAGDRSPQQQEGWSGMHAREQLDS